MRQVPTWECLDVHKKALIILIGGPMWKILQEEIDLEGPTPETDRVYSGCTERGAKVDLQAVQSKTEMFSGLPTTREADDKGHSKQNIRKLRSGILRSSKESCVFSSTITKYLRKTMQESDDQLYYGQ